MARTLIEILGRLSWHLYYWRALYTAAAVIVALVLLALPAAAQNQPRYCVPYKSMVEMLSDRHNQEITAVGLINEYRAVEIFSNVRSGSFSVITVALDGNSCLVITGTAWDQFNFFRGEKVKWESFRSIKVLPERN